MMKLSIKSSDSAPLLPLLLAAALIAMSHGCSDIMLGNTSIYENVVSARNYDFFLQFPLSVVSMCIIVET